MKKMFVKKDELSLKNGGYLVNSNGDPVFNSDFVNLQKHAEWVVTFAEKAKGKDFVGKTADSLEALKAEVQKAMSKSDVEYVSTPKKIGMELTTKLHLEAMAFINFNKETTKVEKVNKFLQQFNLINEWEEFGIYFTEDICKLNRIYTMAEITASVTQVIDLLD